MDASTAVGTERIVVEEWLPDDPYPLAMVERSTEPALVTATRPRKPAPAPRRRSGGPWPSPPSSASGGPGSGVRAGRPIPAVAAWQLVAIAPRGSYDHQRLLEIDDHGSRLATLAALTEEQTTMLAYRLGGDKVERTVVSPGGALAEADRTTRPGAADGSLPANVSELWALVVAYVKQETVDPIKALGRRSATASRAPSA